MHFFEGPWGHCAFYLGLYFQSEIRVSITRGILKKKTEHRQDSSCLIQDIHTGDICSLLSLLSLVTMKRNRHFYSTLIWPILDISFRARWIMPWTCQFLWGAKARLDNQFICLAESHVAGTDRLVLWSGWSWTGPKSDIILWRVCELLDVSAWRATC